MSSDPAPFVPPERYPSPPKNMYYQVPEKAPAPPAQPPKPVFPWEGNQPRPSRTFASERSDPTPIITGSFTEKQGEIYKHLPLRAHTEYLDPSSSSAPGTPSTPTIKVTQPASEWGNFQLSNAWDEIPQIGRYVEGLQKHRRVKSTPTAGGVSSPLGISSPQPTSPRKSRGFKLTDFPSETERPSLPVTPAPIARPSFWGTDEDASSSNKKPSSESSNPHDPSSQSREGLPAAEGVPAQAEWVCVHGRTWQPSDCICDIAFLHHSSSHPSQTKTKTSTDHGVRVNQDPEARLQKLARQQYEHVLRKLSTDESAGDATDAGERTIPKRSLPFGSEDVTSPTYVAHTAAIEAARRGAGGEFPSKTPASRTETSKSGEGSSAGESQLMESALPRPQKPQ